MWRRTGPAPCSATPSRRGHSERSTVAGARTVQPLLIGSVKTNLGHLEAAAGVAGFIKTVLAVQHGQIPRTLNYQMPNPHIPFQELHLKVVDEEQEWPVTGRVRRAGVSSFGFGGTNAHVVVEQAPELVGVSGSVVSAPVCTLVVSGKTSDRVAATARGGGAVDGWCGCVGGVGAGGAHAESSPHASCPFCHGVCR